RGENHRAFGPFSRGESSRHRLGRSGPPSNSALLSSPPERSPRTGPYRRRELPSSGGELPGFGRGHRGSTTSPQERDRFQRAGRSAPFYPMLSSSGPRGVRESPDLRSPGGQDLPAVGR